MGKSLYRFNPLYFLGFIIFVACSKHRLIHSISSSSFSRLLSLMSLPPPPSKSALISLFLAYMWEAFFMQLIKLQLSLFKFHLLVVQFVSNIPEFLSGGGNLCLYLNCITKMILHIIFKFGYGRLLI